MVSLHWKESLEPAPTIGIHTKSRNNEICRAESAAASRAQEADEHRDACRNEGTAREIRPE